MLEEFKESILSTRAARDGYRGGNFEVGLQHVETRMYGAVDVIVVQETERAQCVNLMFDPQSANLLRIESTGAVCPGVYLSYKDFDHSPTTMPTHFFQRGVDNARDQRHVFFDMQGKVTIDEFSRGADEQTSFRPLPDQTGWMAALQAKLQASDDNAASPMMLADKTAMLRYLAANLDKRYPEIPKLG